MSVTTPRDTLAASARAKESEALEQLCHLHDPQRRSIISTAIYADRAMQTAREGVASLQSPFDLAKSRQSLLCHMQCEEWTILRRAGTGSMHSKKR